MINKERLKKSFLEMVKITSPTYKERKFADYIIENLKTLKIDFYEDNTAEKINGTAGNIIFKINGSIEGNILISAHMDTVEIGEHINVMVDEDIIKTDGKTILGSDDKAAIAIIFECIRSLKEDNIEHKTLIIVLSVAEETGLWGAKNIDISSFGKIDMGFVLDAGGEIGIAYNMAPYSAKGTIKIEGKAAHAGANPEDGINAFIVASEAIRNLKIGRIDENTTCNIGKVSGGVATNIVMENIELMYEARSLYEEKLDDLLTKTMNEFERACLLYNAKLSSTVRKGTSGYLIEEKSDVCKIFKKACDECGINFKVKSSGGGSDANIYNSKGIETLNISVGMQNVHTNQEYIKISDMLSCSELLINIISK